MVSLPGALELLPSQVVDAATTRDLRAFVLLYGDSLVLVVSIPSGDGELARQLRRGQHFAVALRKRAGAGSLSTARISVGRARNTDIVLHCILASAACFWSALHRPPSSASLRPMRRA